MDHEAYENEMIDAVNRHAEEKSQRTITWDSPVPEMRSPVDKKDTEILKRGIRRTVLALVTALVFALAVFSFIATATAPGYLAVFLFITGLATLACVLVLLYAQGIINEES